MPDVETAIIIGIRTFVSDVKKWYFDNLRCDCTVNDSTKFKYCPECGKMNNSFNSSDVIECEPDNLDFYLRSGNAKIAGYRIFVPPHIDIFNTEPPNELFICIAFQKSDSCDSFFYPLDPEKLERLKSKLKTNLQITGLWKDNQFGVWCECYDFRY